MTSESAVHAALQDDRNTTPAGPSPDTTGIRTDRNGESSWSSVHANNGVYQRRRVNPESLALRLGPDLVRDLDALITPGNIEMPSFAVRKELQERYSIDRRHIYDYFHSRGLRVVKEDKHGNPITVKDSPTPLPNLRPVRVPIKLARSHLPYPVAAERRLFKPRGVTKAKSGRPKKDSGSAKPKIAPTTTCETNESADSVSEHSSPGLVRSTYVEVNPLLPLNPLPPMAEEDENSAFRAVTNPLDGSFSVRRAIGDVAYAYRHKSVFERMQELAEHPVKCDGSLLWNETSPCSASAEGLLVPYERSLTRNERHAIYDSLSDSIGPAQGIQECQGTYRKHMEAHTKLYFEGLLSSHHHAQPPARASTQFDRKAPLGTSEFRPWLSETRFLKRDINGSPRLHPGHRNASVSKHQGADMVDKKFNQGSISYRLQTLDELFPTPSGNNDDLLTDSPIHTREITRTPVLGDGCSAGDRRLFSVISTSSLPILAVTSVAETRQAGQSQVHGFSGVPGPQEVAMPVVGTDSHPQWSEHDRYVTCPGQHLALSDKLRRGRNMSNNSRIRLASNSPRKHHIRDLDKTRTRPATSRDARRRTTSAAGDI